MSYAQEIRNQCDQDLDKMPSIKEVGVYKVPIVHATQDNLQGYGRIVHDFDNEEVEIVTWPQRGFRPVVPGTGRGGGIVEDLFVMQREGGQMYAVNHAVKSRYLTGWFGDPANMTKTSEPQRTKSVLTHEANYHPDGGQVFFSQDGKPFVALLAKPGDNVRPEDFVAFYFDGSYGVQIGPNVWHQPVFPCGDTGLFRNKQGAVHACVSVDFVEEFKQYLEVPLVIE